MHACENPQVLQRLATAGVDRPLACTSGNPSAAGSLLLGRTVVRYHGDFDWPGIAIANSVIKRHSASAWHMTAADYQAAIREDADHVKLSGGPEPTGWDPSLADAMIATGRAVYEESVADPLIADLAD